MSLEKAKLHFLFRDNFIIWDYFDVKFSNIFVPPKQNSSCLVLGSFKSIIGIIKGKKLGKYQMENIRPATIPEDGMKVLLKPPQTSRQYFIEESSSLFDRFEVTLPVPGNFFEVTLPVPVSFNIAVECNFLFTGLYSICCFVI